MPLNSVDETTCLLPPGDSISLCNHRRAPVVFSSLPAGLMYEECVLARVCVCVCVCVCVSTCMCHMFQWESHMVGNSVLMQQPLHYKKRGDFHLSGEFMLGQHKSVLLSSSYIILYAIISTINVHNATNKHKSSTQQFQ